MHTRIKISLTLLLITFSYSFGKIDDFLKKIENKDSGHAIKNIDFIYMINLDERPEKYQRSLNALAPFNIQPYRFSAVNGWTLDIDVINQLGVHYLQDMNFVGFGTTYEKINNREKINFHEPIEREGTCYFRENMSKGAIGIILSHLSVLKDALLSGYQTVWIMEDDIEVFRDPNILSNLIEKLDKIDPKWDILFTDSETRDQDGLIYCCATCPRPNFKIHPKEYYCLRKRINRDFTYKRARYGAYSMIVRRSGITKILEFFRKYNIFSYYDIDLFYAPDLRVYTCNKPVVTTRINAESDNAKPGYVE